MATVAQIDNFAIKMYPKTTNTDQPDRITFINDIHKDIHLELTKYKKNAVISAANITFDSTYLIQKAYDFIKDELYLSSNNNPAIDDTDIQVKFAQIGEFYYDDKYYYNDINDKISLVKNGKILISTDLTDYKLKYKYYPSPNSLTNTSDIPNLDVRYHDLIKFKLIQRLASRGDNPDTEVANYWDAEYKELMLSVIDDSKLQIINNPTKRPSSVVDVYGGW